MDHLQFFNAANVRQSLDNEDDGICSVSRRRVAAQQVASTHKIGADPWAKLETGTFDDIGPNCTRKGSMKQATTQRDSSVTSGSEKKSLLHRRPNKSKPPPKKRTSKTCAQIVRGLILVSVLALVVLALLGILSLGSGSGDDDDGGGGGAQGAVQTQITFDSGADNCTQEAADAFAANLVQNISTVYEIPLETIEIVEARCGSYIVVLRFLDVPNYYTAQEIATMIVTDLGNATSPIAVAVGAVPIHVTPIVPSPTATPTLAPPTVAPPTVAPPTVAPPTVAPPTVAPPTVAPPTVAPPTVAPPTVAPPTVAPPTAAPPTPLPTLPTPAPTFAPVPDNYCEDGNPCTVGDALSPTNSAICRASTMLRNCDDGNPATNNMCYTDYGCILSDNAGFITCETHDSCQLYGRATASMPSCSKSGVPLLNCEDGNVSTTDLCDNNFGCVHFQNTVPVPCTDGDMCTVGDTFDPSTRTCMSGLVRNCDDGNASTVDFCHGSIGCINYPASEPLRCKDRNMCTVNDTYNPFTGSCEPGPARQCDDGDPSTVDSCDRNRGCLIDGVPTSTECEAFSACTVDDNFDLFCRSGPAKDCDDGDAGTVDVCNSAFGCVHIQAVAPLPCESPSQCYVNSTVETTTGTCQNGNVASCDDGDASTVDFCDYSMGCIHYPNDVPLRCGNGDMCTVNDTYVPNSGCVAGVPLDCDDGDPQTMDTCDATIGCVNLPLGTVVPCEDGKYCTSGDYRDENFGFCLPGRRKSCPDDGDATTLSYCSDNECVTLPIASLCAEAYTMAYDATDTGGFVDVTLVNDTCDAPVSSEIYDTCESAEFGASVHTWGSNRGYWYTFVGTVLADPSKEARMTVATGGSNFDTSLAVYTGECPLGADRCLVGDDDSGPGVASELQFIVEAGVRYTIFASGYISACGNLVMRQRVELIDAA